LKFQLHFRAHIKRGPIEAGNTAGTAVTLVRISARVLHSPHAATFSRIIGLLSQMKERPWPEVCRGKPITERWLAGKHRPFKIASSNIRIDDEQAKGYESAHFKEAFDRYLSAMQGEFIRPTVPKSDSS
jgi:hypothetical protein